jgi:hypothetical protein
MAEECVHLSTSPTLRTKDSNKKDTDDWTPHRSSVQALKQAKIVQSTVPVVEGLSYHEWLEQSGFGHDDLHGTSPAGSARSQGSAHKVVGGSDETSFLLAKLENEARTRQELERRLDSLHKHHERERKMLLEQARSGQSALQEAIRLEKESRTGNRDAGTTQLRSQLSSAQSLADLRTQEVQQLLLVKHGSLP